MTHRAVNRLTEQLRAMANLVEQLYKVSENPPPGQKARSYPELDRIAGRLERVNAILEAGLKKGVVTLAQERRMGAHFVAIGNAMEKAARSQRTSGSSRSAKRPAGRSARRKR